MQFRETIFFFNFCCVPVWNRLFYSGIAAQKATRLSLFIGKTG